MFNKFPFYPILVLFTLFSMSLTACNAAPTLTAPESTSAPESNPTPRSTETETLQPTETPTVVPTATEIPDPTMPLGEIGKDAEGTYVKMENGDIARKVEYKNLAGEILYEGWAVEKTQKGGIPLLDYSDANLNPSSLFVDPSVAESHGIVSLIHQDNIDQGVNSDALTATVIAELYKRHFHKDAMQLSESEMLDYRLSILSGEARLPFITSTGESVEGKLSFITIVVPYDSLVPTEENGVSEWLDPYPESRFSFRSTVLGVDKDGNVIGLIASEKPLNELPDRLVRMLVLYHAGNIINEEDQTTQGFPSVLKGFITSAGASGAEKVPDIIITRNP